MEDNKVLLLSQLLSLLQSNFENFEKSYLNKDKENFDKSKKALLEVQKKLNYVLKND